MVRFRKLRTIYSMKKVTNQCSCGRLFYCYIFNEAGNHTIFTPIVMSAFGAMVPSMMAFLKEVYGRAKEADKFLMSQKPALKYTWNTMVASSFWDMRLSIACNTTDPEYRKHIILHENAIRLLVVAHQPHPRSQLRATRGGAPPCRRLKDFGRHVMISELLAPRSQLFFRLHQRSLVPCFKFYF